ncbi:hypothetical protein [Flavobacterium sp. 22076]|uniref:hypothetical protein n=1 Tax=unclassified Flavobacterium TaxID=196869 RepID=UPI003F864150
MNLIIPEIIREARIDRLDIVWNEENFNRYIHLLVTNYYLEEQISKISYKGCISLAASLSEWNYWYLNSDKRSEIFVPVINALWASVIDPVYLKSFYFHYGPEIENSKTPIEVNLAILSFLLEQYTDKKYMPSFTTKCLINLIVFTQNLIPHKRIFNKWLSESIYKLLETFPLQYYADITLKGGDMFYDSYEEKSIPRDFFFETSFIYNNTESIKLLNQFLGSLNWKTNQFLSSPNEVLQKGFKGNVPYFIQ